MGANRTSDPAGQGWRSSPRGAVHEVMNGLLYVLETGGQWRALRKSLPSRSTVHDDVMLWEWDRTVERIDHELYVKTLNR